MLEHELGSVQVVHSVVCLDEILTHSMDVVNHHKFYLLLINSGCQIDKKSIVLLKIVAVRYIYTLSNHLISDRVRLLLNLGEFGRFCNKVVYRKTKKLSLACQRL